MVDSPGEDVIDGLNKIMDSLMAGYGDYERFLQDIVRTHEVEAWIRKRIIEDDR